MGKFWIMGLRATGLSGSMLSGAAGQGVGQGRKTVVVFRNPNLAMESAKLVQKQGKATAGKLPTRIGKAQYIVVEEKISTI